MTTIEPVSPTTWRLPPLPKFDWTRIWKRLLYWLSTLIAKGVVVLICEEVVTGGVSYLFPEMGKRLWKVPFFAFLNDYEATHRITLAHVFVLVPVISTFMLWSLIFQFYLTPARFAEKFRRFDVERNKQAILIIGAIVIAADAGMFCASFSMSSWGGGTQCSPTAVLATALYVATIAFVSLVSLYLSDDLAAHKEKEG